MYYFFKINQKCLIWLVLLNTFFYHYELVAVDLKRDSFGFLDACSCMDRLFEVIERGLTLCFSSPVDC